MKRFIIIFITAICTLSTHAFELQNPVSDDIVNDSIARLDVVPYNMAADNLGFDSIYVNNMTANDSLTANFTTQKKRNIIQRVIDYFANSNKENSDKKFDVTFAGGPSYSSSTSVQLALVAAGAYRMRRDSLTTPSNVTLVGQVSVTGFYRVAIRGNHYQPNNNFKIDYDLDFYHFPLYFWGIGYDMAINNDNKSTYTELNSNLLADFQWRIKGSLYLGPSIRLSYGDATKAQSPWLWEGQHMRNFCYGIGAILSYDSRDIPTNPSKGINVQLRETVFPHWLGNKTPFTMTELTMSGYHRFWKSGIVAMQLHGCLSTGNTPWDMMPTIDRSNGVRSYYEGRFRDKNEIDAVVEIRQHVWRRNSIVVWGGAGLVFPDFESFTLKKILPTYGIGYRWELKRNMNVRVDAGFGKGSMAFSVSLNEAF